MCDVHVYFIWSMLLMLALITYCTVFYFPIYGIYNKTVKNIVAVVTNYDAILRSFGE